MIYTYCRKKYGQFYCDYKGGGWGGLKIFEKIVNIYVRTHALKCITSYLKIEKNATKS